MSMGTTNGVTRGQLRPHFAGRNPPFLVAALCVGIGILGVSYWSLSNQYNDLEEQLRRVLQKKETLEDNGNVIQNQLNVREEEFSHVKGTIIKKEEEINKLNNQINGIHKQLDAVKDINNKCKDDISKKENEIADAKTKITEVEEQKNSFGKEKENAIKELNAVRKENDDLLKQINELNKKITDNGVSGTNVSVPSNTLKGAAHEPLSTNNEIKRPINEQRSQIPLKESHVENAPVESVKVSHNNDQTTNSKRIIEPPPDVNELKPNDISDQNVGPNGQLDIKPVQDAPVGDKLPENDKRDDNLMDAANANEISDYANAIGKDETNKDGVGGQN